MIEPTVTRSQLRKFGLLMAAVLSLLFALLFPFLWQLRLPLWAWTAPAGFAMVAAVWPTGLRAVYRIWMALGHALGSVNTRLLLALTFYCIVTPLGLIARLVKGNRMARRFETARASYREPSERPKPEHMERPY